MATVTFFIKPNCVNHRKQRDRILQDGHTVVVKDLLQYHWTVEELRSFLANRPKGQWFNPASPAVLSGRIDPKLLSEDEALQAMLKDHSLIRRPLIDVQGHRFCGFDWSKIHSLLEEEEPLGDQEPLTTIH